MTDWEEDCMEFRGRVLDGTYAHWCNDWDWLPIDETTPEWPCNCDVGRPLRDAELPPVESIEL